MERNFDFPIDRSQCRHLGMQDQGRADKLNKLGNRYNIVRDATKRIGTDEFEWYRSDEG